MPQHVQRWTGVREIELALKTFPGILLAGSGTHGLGIPDCVASAERAVAALGADDGDHDA